MKENNLNNTPTTEKISSKNMPEEFGGTKGLEPTRYGDWEKGGRVSDF